MFPGDVANGSSVESFHRQPASDSHKEAAAAKVLEMLQKHGKGLSSVAQQQIAKAVADSLAEPEPPNNRPGSLTTAGFSRAAGIADGDILIPQYDIRAAMGHGQVPADYAETIRNVVISESLLKDKGVTYSSPSHLAVITGWGQSMEGTINDKDPVIVDRGVNEYVGDGVYVITWAGHLFIKRLQLAGENQLELISDNPNHKDRIVPMDEVTIHAKVLLVWSAKKV
ncbi:Phage repressor protein C, contains Cro/C1-type HTH and peptisase s24 domains [Azotobacter beijerinckii]|uniref:Phage repressor protein C, contains Cro/C1-type HTH and peptisase s24 domains n=2 Tax=Azotobacter beijerinckii TaxID=170623 RepID=A0A1H6XI94_9GAMM|nr:Phage repressor protein C, contains Cro/C1-type HTH and peptisase s24 domains [Azotobacter beijerinckii]